MNGLVRRLFCLVLLLLAAAGCTERRLFIRTEPGGAIVRVNGAEIGVAPVTWEFDHYGPVRIEIELEGYQPRQRVLYLESPWWQKPGIDVFSDVLIPFTMRDDHELTLALQPTPPRTDESTERDLRGLVERARALRARAEEPDE